MTWIAFCVLFLSLIVAHGSAGAVRFFQKSSRPVTVGRAHEQIPPYTESYVLQRVDHFNYENQDTYLQRFLLCDSYWTGTGPLFFYTGNEGPIEEFYLNTGFLFVLAQEFKALVVFAEHRYYGESLPYDAASFQPKNIGYLSAEQALADYAVTIQLIYAIPAYQNITKVISFGGSYGGMLSAWFRFKYPNMVDGALAASAPILMVAGLTPPSAFFQVVTQDYAKVNAKCPDLVREAFVRIADLAAQGEQGLAKLTDVFHLCSPLTVDMVDHLSGWVRNSFTSLAMSDYPYPTSFLAPLPASPVTVSCQRLLAQPDDPLAGLREAAGLFYNGTAGILKCFNISAEYISDCSDPTGCGTGPAAVAWDYQACTEMTLPCNTNNITDMFPPVTYDPSMHCSTTWGAKIRDNWMDTQFWGRDIGTASNIIFSNGDLDPWHVGGILESKSESVVAIVIEGGAHHLDLRSPNPQDPPAVVKARQQERDIIEQWLKS